MRKLLLFAAFLASYAGAQTISPSQIKPSTTNGYIIKTVSGVAVWAPGGPGGGCSVGGIPTSNGIVDGDSSSTNCGTDNRTSDTASVPANVQTFGHDAGAGNKATETILIGDTPGANLNPVSGSDHDLVGIGDFVLDCNLFFCNEGIAIGDSVANLTAGSNFIGLGNGSLSNSFVTNTIGMGQGAAATTAGDQPATTADVIALGNGAVFLDSSTTPGDPIISFLHDVIGVGNGAGSHIQGNSHDILGLGDGSGANYATGTHDIVAAGNGAGSGVFGSKPTLTDIVALGDNVCPHLGTGSSDVFCLGHGITPASLGAVVNNAIGIGSGITLASNSATYGNSSITQTDIYGTTTIHGAGTINGLDVPEGTAGSGTSGRDKLWADATSHCWMISNNGGSGVCIPTSGGSSPLTTKGDLFGHSTVDARIPVGTDGQVLSADSTQALGVKWIASAGGTPAGVWQHEGSIISPTLGEQFNATEPSLLYEGSPQLLTGTTGNVFKMWWTCGWNSVGLCYAESVDGETWKRAASPVIARSTTGPSHGQVFHYGSTYYYYAANLPNAGTAYDRYESANGYTGWTLTHASVLSHGTGWESGALGNIYVIPSAGTWLAMYEAYGTGTVGQMGVASSADQGVTWTKYGGNPVISVGAGVDEAGGPEIHLVGSTYYVWGQCSASGSVYPDDICRWHATTFLANDWTIDNSGAPVFTRASVDEGSANPIGQIADPSMVEVNGSVYMAYEGVLAQDGTTPDAFHLKLATAPYTFANLVQTNEGNATAFRSSGGFNNLNLSTCVYWDNNFSRIPCANDTGQFFIGNLNFRGGTAGGLIGNNIYTDGTNNLRIVAGPAAFTNFDTGTGKGSFAVAPTGAANSVISSFVFPWQGDTDGLHLPYLTANTNTLCLGGTGGAITNVGCAGGGSSAFSALTSSTNTTAAMVVGSGASLAPTGTGTIQANSIGGTVAATSPITLTGSGTTASPYTVACPTCGTSSGGTNVSQNSGSTEANLAITGHMPQLCNDSSGSGTAQSCTAANTFVPQAGNCMVYKTTTANSGTGLTVNVNSLGAKSIAVAGASGWTTTLVAGSSIPANKPMNLCYDGTNWDASGTGFIPTSNGAGAWTNITSTVTVSGCAVSSGQCVVGTPGASVSFSSIPGTYRRLIIEATVAVSTATTCGYMQFNGDTGANYATQGVSSSTTVTTSSNSTGATPNIGCFTGTNLTNSSTQITADIDLYAGAFLKNAFVTDNWTGTTLAGLATAQRALMWNSTAAITSVLINANGANFVAGSSFSVYGVN